MYDDDEYLKGLPSSCNGILPCILIAIIFAICMVGCIKAPPKLRTIQIPNEALILQISSCNQNDGVKYWTVTIEEGYVVKTSIVCNNGMVKDFEAKDI